jgi:hypothetical protein
LPTNGEFDAVRCALWNVFEILLMVLAMTAVVMVAFRHIPRSFRRRRRKSSPRNS